MQLIIRDLIYRSPLKCNLRSISELPRPPLRRTELCGGGDVPVLVSYGSRGPYEKGSDIAEPKTFT